ncbi:MAG: hypothetical protein GWN84_20360 [Gammaproteobacteria bacterium]|nr:hypothetical protein [Gammaproteobacteria bacterium]NIR85115.1 hypothetical protein [Gammaproteobacteria bacterium]NIR92044.1 hypothetical protein [Gammaproteobacteria bacterium]NIU06164.1 hypothetical protein [Gammaproteobacteria bacterium]NIV53163.1 hypothetical protein [Gammaproteobacteria bacterium]
MVDRLLADNFDIGAILEALRSLGATSVRCMDEEYRVVLAEEAARCAYRPGEAVVGSGDRLVRQQLAVADEIPEGGAFSALRDEFQRLMDGLLSQLEGYPFESRLWFNETVLQKYERGSIGITPHRDHIAYVNLVCIFNLAGRGRFGVAPDRSGRDARFVDAVPGNVILMRAPGFRGARRRPFHFVSDIEETRYVFGLRQIRPQEEAIEHAPRPRQLAHARMNL